MKLNTFILTLILINVFSIPVYGYILDVEKRPEYCEDCIIPLEVEIMETKEYYQIVVLVSMLIMNLLIMYLMYLNAKQSDPKTTFSVQYLIYAILGVVIGFNWFTPSMSYEGTYLDVFFSSAAFAIAGEGLVNKGAKAAKTIFKNKNGETNEQ